MNMRSCIESTVALLGGVGIGGALMYLFDPEMGEKRRRRAREAAEETLSATGERLSGTWESIADKAHDLASHAAGAVSGLGSSAGAYADDAADQARSYGRRLSKSARGYARDTGRAASRWFGGRRETSHTGEMIVSACAALALGAGLMFVLDPAQGRRRRALIRDKAIHAAKETSRYVEGKSRDLSNRAQGAVAKARNFAESAKEKIAGEPQPQPSGQTFGAT
jgi:gas vesicle protein